MVKEEKGRRSEGKEKSGKGGEGGGGRGRLQGRHVYSQAREGSSKPSTENFKVQHERDRLLRGPNSRPGFVPGPGTSLAPSASVQHTEAYQRSEIKDEKKRRRRGKKGKERTKTRWSTARRQSVSPNVDHRAEEVD
jgi:hypothetical protein